MKTTVTKKIIGLVCSIIISAAAFAQPERIVQQINDCEALKKWYNEGSIVVEGHVMESKWIETGANDEGYYCFKVKINKILKGKMNAGYFNLFLRGKRYMTTSDIGPNDVDIVGWTGKSVFKIRPTKLTQEGYATENKGVYATEGIKAFGLEEEGFELYYKNVDGKRVLTNCNEEFYKIFYNCCGIKENPEEKKSPASTINNDSHGFLYKQKEEFEKIDAFWTKRIANQNQRTSTCNELFISEYLCGQGNNKAIEIYNPTHFAVNLSNYTLLIYHGASYTPTTILLTGTISAQSTYVISKQNASSAILAHANQTSNNLNFNGDGCIVLNKASIHIDKIGEIGVAIGSGGWTLTPSGSTNNSDLRRKYSIGQGDTTWANCKGEWNVFIKDSISNLGKHANTCSTVPDPDLILDLINQQTTTSGTNKYFEFDVTAKSNNDSSYLENIAVYLDYNSAAFGSNIVTSGGNLSVTNGLAFNNPATYIIPTPTQNYTSSQFVARVSLNNSNTSWTLTHITTNPQLLMHVKMKILNCYYPANVQFANPTNMLNSAIYYTATNTTFSDNSYTYDNVSYINSALNDTVCQPNITGFLPNPVVAGAAPASESVLNIYGNNFGTSKGKVFLTQVDTFYNPSVHNYTQLDTTDYTWADNQIVVNVPSIMFRIPTIPSRPSLYPGNGTFYVVPVGSPISAFSDVSNPLQISYVIQDLITKNIFGQFIKVRMNFAYRQVTDSSGIPNGDSAAYDFRFDPITITGNANPNCRPLMKIAIKDWACALGIRYRIGRDTNMVNGDTTQDEISYVTFKNRLDDPNFVAQTKPRVKVCTNREFTSEADITFKPTPTKPWYYVSPALANTNGTTQTGTYDFFSVALHELGHASLLNHVNDIADLMYYATFDGGFRGSISSNDLDGGLDNVGFAQGITYTGTCVYSPFKVPASGSGACADPTNGVTGIETIGNNTFEISVYPNPAGDYLNVTFVKDKESSNTVKLTNTLGQTVFYRNIGKNEGANEVINLAGLAKGIYILIVTDNQNTVTKKIIAE